MPDRCLLAVFCVLALAACGRNADPALQIYADSKGSVIVTGTLGDERSRHDLALAVGQSLAANGKGGNVAISVDNKVRLAGWTRKLQEAIPALTGITGVGFTVHENTVLLAGEMSAEERRALPAALQKVFGPGYVITLAPAKIPATALAAADPLADPPLDPMWLAHAWSVEVTTPATRKERTAGDPRAGFTLSNIVSNKAQALPEDQLGKFELDSGVICTLGAARDRERFIDGRMLNESVRFIECPGATIDGGPAPESKEDNAAGCSHIAGQPVYSTERHTRRFTILRGIIQVGSLLVECRPERASAQSEGRIAPAEGAAK